jgi:small subunit ribosomal protein S3
MGQKIIPISLRLKNKKNWHSQWIVDKKNYAQILHFDLELRKYIEIILNNKQISTLQIKINKISKNLYIYIFIHQNISRKILKKKINILKHLNLYLNNQYNIKIFILKAQFKCLKYRINLKSYIYKYLKKNRKIKKNKKILKFLNICHIAFTLSKINIISKYIIRTIKKKKNNRGYLTFINKILKEYFKMNSKILGYKIQIKGRINGSKRKRKNIFQEGCIPLSTLNKDIKYTFDEFITKSGVCSLKMWFFFKTLKKRKINKLNKINKKFININQKFKNLKTKKYQGFKNIKFNNKK